MQKLATILFDLVLVIAWISSGITIAGAAYYWLIVR